MANNTIQLKRSSVAGKQPNTSTLAIGELAINLTDKKLYSSDGTNIFETGANLTTLNVSTNTSVNNVIITGGVYANGNYGSANQVLTSNGSGVYWATSTGGGGGGSYSAVQQQYTANGSVSTFSVTGGYIANNLSVYLNGVLLRKGTEVDVTNGSSFTITPTPSNGALIDAIGVSPLNANGFNTIVSEQFTANGTANSFQITGGYVPNQVQVYVNGVKQLPNVDVILTSGNTVNLITTPANGYSVDVFGIQTAITISSNTLSVGNVSINNDSITVGNSSVNTQIVAGNVFLNGSTLVVGNTAANVTINATSISVGTGLTINSSAVYVGGSPLSGTNTSAQYTWTNTQTFTNTITFNSTINGTANNSSYLNGKTESNLNVNSAITSNASNYLGGNTASDLRSYSDTAAATSYSNATSYADNKAANAYSNAIAYSGNAAQAYSNATSYADTKSSTAYSNATTYSSNASNISSGTLAEARLPFRMDQNVRKADNIEFHDALITGNLTVSGNVTVIGANNLSVVDNMIYLNSNSAVTNPDLGFAGNYNDGTYQHTGFFRDASDGVWKVFDSYLPEPDASPYIDTSNTSFHIANFQANVIYVGNTSVYSTINTTSFSGTSNNSSYLQGYQTSTSGTANTIALRNTSGDIFARYLNMTHAVATRTTDNVFFSSTDAYIRKNDASGFKQSLSLNNVENVALSTWTGSANISIVNTAYIATLSANAATYLNGKTEANLNVNNSLTSNNSSYLGGTAAAGYQTTAGLSANVATLAANSSTYANSSVTNTFTVGTASWFVSNGSFYVGSSTGFGEKFLVKSTTLDTGVGNTVLTASYWTPDTNNTTRLLIQDYRFSIGNSHTTSRTLIQRRVDSTSMGYLGFDSSATSIGWGTTEAMRIDSSGRWLLGTTTGVGNDFACIQFSSAGSYPQGLNMKDSNASASATNFQVFRKSDDTYLGNIRRNSTDNALYVGGNSYLSLGSGDTERMRIDSSGNVGIGNIVTSSGRLTVTGSGGATANSLFLNNVDGTYNPYLQFQHSSNGVKLYASSSYGGAASNLSFASGGTDVMTLNSSGNVGIGGAGSVKLEVYGESRVSYGVASGAILSMASSSVGSSGSTIEATYYTGGYGPLMFKTGGSERMRIDSSGNVGVGCTPSVKMQVASSTTNAILKISNSTTGSSVGDGLDIIVDGNDGYVWNRENGPLLFGTNSTEAARIDSSGNLLVGTTSAFNGAHTIVKGTNTADLVLTVAGGGSVPGVAIYFGNNGGTPNAANSVMKLGLMGGNSRSINAAGTINASGADYAEYMVKAGDFTVAKGDVVGISADGKLTNVFADAVSFVVKSTNPSYVGGDTWGIGFDGDEEGLEAARQSVDRIAFAGQVPVNVIGATAGQYIVPVNDKGKIKGTAVSNPTFEQYQIAVGKVIAIEDDGRARIIVKVA